MIRDITVLKLQKRLDDDLTYLRDALPEYRYYLNSHYDELIKNHFLFIVAVIIVIFSFSLSAQFLSTDSAW